MKALRIPLFDFPDVLIHADELAVKKHAAFRAAKAGDIAAAGALIADLANMECIEGIRSLVNLRAVELVSVHALESEGVNEIPASLANWIAEKLALPISRSIVQSNSVGHTGASGFERLAHQALFEGDVSIGQLYFLVDDFVGQGGTLANLIGFIHAGGGIVTGATVLTGKPYSVKLAPDNDLIQLLRNKHGIELEGWWQQITGFGFDCLTRSEARYLEKTPDADSIRSRLVAAGLKGSANLPGKQASVED